MSAGEGRPRQVSGVVRRTVGTLRSRPAGDPERSGGPDRQVGPGGQGVRSVGGEQLVEGGLVRG